MEHSSKITSLRERKIVFIALRASGYFYAAVASYTATVCC